MTRAEAQAALIASAQAMHQSGAPLMRRILPPETAVRFWDHYPARDVINGAASSRYFYHCHPEAEREGAEHGHFHLFVGKHAMPAGTAPLIVAPTHRRKRADAVHIAALAVGMDGVPVRWFTVNRWVTDEWLYPAATVIAALPLFDPRGATGDPLVSDWLNAMVHLSRDVIAALLAERDTVLAAAALAGEDRALDVISSAPVDLAALLDD